MFEPISMDLEAAYRESLGYFKKTCNIFILTDLLAV